MLKLPPLMTDTHKRAPPRFCRAGAPPTQGLSSASPCLLHVDPADADAARGAIQATVGRPLERFGSEEDDDILDVIDALDAAGVPYSYEVSQDVEDAPDLPEPDRTKLLRLVD